MLRHLLLAALTFAVLPVLASGEDIVLDPPPGTYADPIDLRITAPEGSEIRLGGEERFFEPPQRLRLDALPGTVEEFSFTLRDGEESRDFSYTVDRLPPLPPTPTLPEGRYLASVVVDFDAPEVEYLRQGRYEPVPEEGILLDPGSGRQEVYTLRVRSIDEAGNRSVPEELTYVVDRTLDDLEGESILLSPLPGTYRNPQGIIPDFRLWRDVRYTLDGGDPERGAVLEEPTRLEGAGEITLRVGALHRVTGEYREQEVTLTQGGEDSPFPESGVYPGGVRVDPPEEGRYRFLLTDRPGSGSRQLLLEPLSLEPPPGNRRFVYLQGERIGEEGIFGHAYLLDDRRPPEPTLLLRRVGTRSFTLTLFSLPEALLDYTVSGNDEPHSGTYTSPVTLTLPEGVEETTLRVEAVAQIPGGRRSPLVTRELPVSLGPPEPPQLRLRERRESESLELFIDAPGGTLFGAPPDGRVPPNALSFEPFITLLPPAGIDREYELELRSVSSDGWLLSEAAGVTVPVDTLPPDPPTINLRGTRVSITGRENIAFRVVADLAGAPSSEEEFTPYEGSLRLEAPPNSAVTYRVEARSLDEAGNSSSLALREVRIDSREPVIPPLRGIEDGGRYREGELFLSFENPYPEELSIFYELDGSGEPSRESPSVRRRLRIETPEGVERSYTLRIRAGFGEGELSPTETIRFTVDRIPPEAPEILLPSGEGAYPRDVELRLRGGEGELYFAVAPDEPADPLGPGGRRYAAPLRISGREGEEQRFYVTAASRDAAGNVTRVPEAVSFLIDRAPPAPPEILLGEEAVEGRLVTSSSGELRFAGEGSIFVSSRREGQRGELTSYQGEPLTLEGEAASIVTYRVEAFAVDEAGNRSATRRLELVIDQEPPADAGTPEIVYAVDGRSGTMFWPGEAGTGRLFVASLDGLTVPRRPGEELPRPVEGALRWRLLEGEREGRVELFSQDEAGNRSETRVVTVEERSSPAPPRFVGAPAEEAVREPVTLTIEEVEGTEVRYTLSTTGTLPPAVTRESPLFEGEQTFTAAAGEALSYVIRARAFNQDGEASEQQVLRFTIDREPPPPVEINGVSSGEFYSEAQRFSLTGEGEIYYRVIVQGNDPTTPEFQVYQGGEIELPVRDDDLIAYQIEAYARDEAGNRSQQVEQWTVFIDREIVYVSSEAGEEGDGSRNSPYRSIEAGMRVLQRGERSTLFLGPGSYTLPGNLSIDRPIRIIGGFEDERWRPGSGRSSVRFTAADDAAPGPAVRLLPGGALTLRRVEMDAPRGGAAIEVGEGSSLIIDESSLAAETDVALHLLGGEGRLTNSVISVPRGAVSVRGGEGSRLYLRGGEVGPVELLRSRYEITDTVIRATPVTTEAATALSARESRGRLETSLLRSDAGEKNLLLVDVAGGTLEIEESDLVGEAESGVTLIRSRDTRLSIAGSHLEAAGEPDFIYGILSRGGSFEMVNSVLTARDTGSAIAISLEGGVARLAHNAILFSEVGRGFGLSLGGVESVDLVNSQLHNLGGAAEEATLLYLDEPVGRLLVAGNNLSGWARLLSDGEAARQAWGFTSPGILRSLDALHRGDRNLPSLRQLEAFDNISESSERTFEAGSDVIEEREYSLQIESSSIGAGIPAAEAPYDALREVLRSLEGSDEGRPLIGPLRE
ncbi:MAG: hypothetical protein ACLFP6_07090 [Spirochaetaceae bacterium]